MSADGTKWRWRPALRTLRDVKQFKTMMKTKDKGKPFSLDVPEDTTSTSAIPVDKFGAKMLTAMRHAMGISSEDAAAAGAGAEDDEVIKSQTYIQSLSKEQQDVVSKYLGLWKLAMEVYITGKVPKDDDTRSLWKRPEVRDAVQILAKIAKGAPKVGKTMDAYFGVPEELDPKTEIYAPLSTYDNIVDAAKNWLLQNNKTTLLIVQIRLTPKTRALFLQRHGIDSVETEIVLPPGYTIEKVESKEAGFTNPTRINSFDKTLEGKTIWVYQYKIVERKETGTERA